MVEEDPTLASQAVADDLRRSTQALKQTGLPVSEVGYDESGIGPIAPAVPGEQTLIQFAIGARGELTNAYARAAAKAFVEVRKRCPGALLYPHLLGYDDDPRELWQFPEVRRYLRRWARYAGITDWRRAIAVPWVDPGCTLGLLAVYGAFGGAHPFAVTTPPLAIPS
jgi:hypothetical protein